MQAGMRRAGNAVERHVDVLLASASQRGHGAVADFARHGLHALQVSRGGDREAALNDIHSQRFELPRHADFLRHGHRESRRLFAVPQRGIEDAYVVHSLTLSYSHYFTLSAQARQIYNSYKGYKVLL